LVPSYIVGGHNSARTLRGFTVIYAGNPPKRDNRRQGSARRYADQHIPVVKGRLTRQITLCMKQAFQKLIGWIVVSSADPDEVSLTVKGALVAVVPTLMAVAGLAHINLGDGSLLTSFVDGLAQLIQAALTLVAYCDGRMGNRPQGLPPRQSKERSIYDKPVVSSIGNCYNHCVSMKMARLAGFPPKGGFSVTWNPRLSDKL
jgi:hypothetical protein